MTKKIGVLFIQSQAGYGADSVVHSHLMTHLDRERFTVHVACTAGDGTTTPTSLLKLRQLPDVHLRLTRFVPGFRERALSTVLESAPDAVRAPLDLVRLRGYIREHGIRIVHSSERPRDSLYNVGLAKLANAKSVVHVHVKWSHEYSAPAKWAVNHADAVFSISEYVTSTLRGMGRSTDSIHTILNCVNPAHWDPTTSGSKVRDELSIPQDAAVLLSVSRLFAWKGQRELLQAFAKVRAKLDNTFLLIVGADAPHEGTSFTEELKRMAETLGVEPFVRFTGARSDIPEVMAACDLFTMPSFEEPFGLVFLEAMAMERAVVAVDNGGTPEVIVHGETGLLSPAWDIPALTDNIVRLLNDASLRESMGRRGRQRVLDFFTPERMATEAAAAYEEILKA